MDRDSIQKHWYERNQNSEELWKAYSRDQGMFFDFVAVNLEYGRINPRVQSIRRLFELFVPNGQSELAAFSPAHANAVRGAEVFARLMGAFAWHIMRAAFLSMEFEMSKLVKTRHTDLGSDHGYETVKRGLLLDLAKADVFFDNTGAFLDQAEDIGRFIGMSKEARLREAYIEVMDGHRFYSGLDIPFGRNAHVAAVDTLIYMENYPLELVEKPAFSADELPQGTLLRWKASERGGVMKVPASVSEQAA